MNFYNLLFSSWKKTTNTLYSIEDILEWINKKKTLSYVNIKRINLSEARPWYLDSTNGFLQNIFGTFFKIVGAQEFDKQDLINEQIMILQDEIGFLGILTKVINGTLYFLMQAKIDLNNAYEDLGFESNVSFDKAINMTFNLLKEKGFFL
jgi:oxidase EvaA